MRQALGSGCFADRHNVTRTAGQSRSSAHAYSLRAAAATFSYTPSESVLRTKQVQPDLQDVLLFGNPTAVLQPVISSNGRKHIGQQQQQQQGDASSQSKQHTTGLLQHDQQQAHTSLQHQDQQQQEQQQQQQQPHDAGRVQRDWASMRNWQWLALQQQCGSSSSTTLQNTVNILTQLSQPGVAPSRYDRQQQQQYISFLAHLLLTATQQLQRHQQQQGLHKASHAAAAAVSPDDLTDLLWGLAKLRLQPQSPQQLFQQQQQHHHHQQQQQQRQLPTPAVAAILGQRVAEVTQAAVGCLQLQWHLLQQQQQQQQQGTWQQQPACVYYSPRQLALCGWALAKLQYSAAAAAIDSHLFWQQYSSVLQQQLPAMNAQDLSNVIWALAKVQHKPADDWVDEFLAAAKRALCSSSSSGQSLAVIFLNVAQLGVAPAADWIDTVLLSTLQQQQQQQQRCVLQQLDGYALGSVLGALAKWGHVPQQQWLQAVEALLQQQLQKCSGRDVAQISWALATITAAAAANVSSVASANSSVGTNFSSGSGSGSSSRASSSWDNNDQESGLSMLRRQLSHNSSGQHRHMPQHWQQQQQQCAPGLQVSPELLQRLTHRLADTAGSTAPCQVVLATWAITKLHQLMQQQQQQETPQNAVQQQQRHHRLHWQQCRVTLLHCATVVQQQAGLHALDCKHLAMLIWSMSAAGGLVSDASQQQKQQQQQDTRLRPQLLLQSRKTTNTSSSHSTFSIPLHFVQQLLTASRASLAAAEPQSQALILRGLVSLGVQPDWQWLLRFYEATEPQLDCCSAKDLSMMGGALAQLNLRPVGSWMTGFLHSTKTLADSQSFDGECIVTVLAAVASPSWGLVAVQPGSGHALLQQQQQRRVEVLSAGWQEAMQQQVLLLLPQRSLAHVCALMRASAALGWASSSNSGVVSGLLERAVGLIQQQQHHQHCKSGQACKQAVEALQVMAAAAVLASNSSSSSSSVPDAWWSQVAPLLSSRLLQLQRQQQQQQQEVRCLSPEQLRSGIRVITAVLSSKQREQQWQQQQQQCGTQLATCLQQLFLLAAYQVPQLPVSQSLKLLETAHLSLKFVRPARTRPDNQAAGSPGSLDWHVADPASENRCQAALQHLAAAVQNVCVQQMPHAELDQVAKVVQVASRCQVLLHSQHGAPDADCQGHPAHCAHPLLLAAVTVIGQRLASLEELMQDAGQQQQAWQQHPQLALQQHGGILVIAAAAGHLAATLASFARISYCPGSKLLRRMLQYVQLGLPYLSAQQLADVAAAAAVLHLGKSLGPGFRTQYWQALSAALRKPTMHHHKAPAGQSTAAAAAAVYSRIRFSVRSWPGTMQQQSAAVGKRSPGSSSYQATVLLVVTALHELTLPHMQDSTLHHCSWSGTESSNSSSRAADTIGDLQQQQRPCTRGCRGLGVPPPRLLVEQAFKAAAAVWQDVGVRAQDEQSCWRQQVLLLRLLVPLASRLSSSGLKQFTSCVGPQLKQLPGPQKQQAWLLFKQLLAAWRAGKQQRQRLVLLQQQHVLDGQQAQQLEAAAAGLQEDAGSAGAPGGMVQQVLVQQQQYERQAAVTGS